MAEMDVDLARVTTDDRKHQLWAAASSREKAIELVLRALPEGWSAVLESSRLRAEQLKVLNLRPGEVREITFNRRLHEPLQIRTRPKLDNRTWQTGAPWVYPRHGD